MLVIFVLTASARAQAPDDSTADRLARLEARAREETDASVEQSRAAENGAVEVTPTTSGVSLVAARDASSAKLSLSPRDGSKRWAASITTPIRKGDPTTEFVTQVGLAQDVEVAVAWKGRAYSLRRLQEVDFPATDRRQDLLCGRHGLDAPCDATALEAEGADRAAVSDFENFVTRQGGLLSVARGLPVHQWEFGVIAGRTKRSYFSDAAEELDEDRLATSIGGAYGRLVGSTLWKVDARWQRKYEPQTTASRCEPIEGTTLERCKDLPLGRAMEKDLFPLSLELRHWSFYGARRWAVSPRLVYEVEQEVWGASLPLYVVPNADGNLTGGVAVDWEESKDTVFSVFVSAPLSMFF
jgi:hypothetical protein